MRKFYACPDIQPDVLLIHIHTSRGLFSGLADCLEMTFLSVCFLWLSFALSCCRRRGPAPGSGRGCDMEPDVLLRRRLASCASL